MKMNFLIEDLWAIILAKLPLKPITTSKLVCKQWKSIVESPFFRELFLSHHQSSHSSWSLTCRDPPEQVVAYYGCEIWGLPRSLGSYVSSFITDSLLTARLETRKKKRKLWPQEPKFRVVAYTDIGLILLYVTTYPWDGTYYVANPITKQRIEIPHPPFALLGLEIKESDVSSSHARLVTRTENGVVLSYKVVVIKTRHKDTECFVAFTIYSSETGSWSYKTLESPLPLISLSHLDPISLNGNLHWLGINLDHQDVVVSYDFYGSDNQCRVIPFPDSENEEPNFKRSCTTSGGNLMYMNIISEEKDDESVEHKLSVWKLKNGEWQLVFEISPDFIKTGIDYFPLAINPFDGNTMYLWSEMHKSLASVNLRNGNFVLHNELERSSNGQTLSSLQCNREMDTMEYLSESYFSMFVLPRWLYRIPGPP